MTTVPRFAALAARAHWRTVDFISDLHLKPEEPHTFQAWQHYLLRTPADAVFILGDLFEAWVGDDGALPGSFEAHCSEVLRVAGAAMDVFFMRGNRDFLVGGGFLGHCGVHDLADPTVLTFHGRAYLLTHGDLLCTDDVAYQQFRRQVRAPEWQASFLARPLPERQAMARQMREHSQAHHATQAVYAHADAGLACRWLNEANATVLIHGHTHQPGDHALGANALGQPLTQVVLSDWHLTATERRQQVLRLTAEEGLQRV
ncbi:UDP-2,3-diacylglucosamine diphosphatase [Ottowia testudinis]|uniref:UDP-2,3-diacylglucosamine hydrolase n=1 Tax=Ottowia testudinis TaxID=2816950 RepID=A0A975CHH0_9BURK|nr:UDP-2,3-diacylglucosamine diphosphatase [Ottowia testudinis]QTD46285.1 UDP-2,3-diacylglucosamine diphosphatase [Ottowia testudinis]